MKGRAIIVLLAIFVVSPTWARKRKADSLVVDFAAPLSDVLQAVNDVAASGSIAGSAEYEKEAAIDGAIADTNEAFGPWAGRGKAVYKSRTGVLSPIHFIGSNDTGTVTVRYVVEAVNSATTRVMIDAIFVEASHRHRHPSDGSVEVAELGEIQERLNALQEDRADSRRRAQEEALEPLRRAIKEEKAQLDATTAEVTLLEQRAAELKRQVTARTKSPVELRAAPYYRAASLKSLAPGDSVQVLATTDYWCRVRDKQGKDGWVLATTLEVLP
jgi:hypothetical protein